MGPGLGEEVIEKDIDDDACKASSFRSEEHFGFEKNRVSIGEGIDLPMEHDAVDEVLRIVLEERLARSPDEITEQGPGPGGVSGAGEMEMGEEVQGLRA